VKEDRFVAERGPAWAELRELSESAGAPVGTPRAPRRERRRLASLYRLAATDLAAARLARLLGRDRPQPEPALRHGATT